MTQPIITDNAIHKGATPDIYRRGQQYVQQGAVRALTIHGRTLTGEVKGSRSRPYRVTCELPANAGEEIAATCTCPYEWGGWCKHIVAVLLAYITDASLVAERPPLADLLAPLTRDQLQATLLYVAATDGKAADAIARYTATFAIAPSAGSGAPAQPAQPTQPAQVNTDRLRREIKTALRHVSNDRRHSYDYYDDEYNPMDDVMAELQPFLRQSEDYIEADDGRNAIRILEVVTEQYLTTWAPDEDAEEPESTFFAQVGPLWTEALLSGDFTRAERKTWSERLSAWSEQVEDYVDVDHLASALSAASEGWDHPLLQRILRNELTDEERGVIEQQVAQARLSRNPWLAKVTVAGVPDDFSAVAPELGSVHFGLDMQERMIVDPFWQTRGGIDDSGDELIQARLRVLARRGRYDEYLAFARLLGEPLAYTTMLVQRGRLDEAATYGREHLRTTDGVLALAKALLERDAPTLAFAVAERGLALGGHKAQLARWLRDAATERGATALALAAALALYQEEISLDNYLAAQRLVGDGWPTRREGMLAIAQHSRYNPAGPVDIFLHEGLLDDAINALGSPISQRYYSEDSTLNKVIDVAITQRPDWVIQTCRTLAERIMDEGRAGHYEEAARLLGKAREAYLGANRKEEWQTYLAETVERHRRKYKLVPLLKALA